MKELDIKERQHLAYLRSSINNRNNFEHSWLSTEILASLKGAGRALLSETEYELKDKEY